MKTKLKFLTILSAIALFVSVTPAYGRNGNAIEIARQMKEQTDRTIDSVKSSVESINADSLAETVVFDNHSENDNEFNNSAVKDDSWDAALLIPIFAVILGILTPAAVVVLITFFICQYRRQKVRDRNDIIRQAIAAGYQLPDSFYLQEKHTARLQSGIVWIGWGIAISLLYFLSSFGKLWLPVGIIMMFVGISRLVVYFITRNENRCEVEDNCETDA